METATARPAKATASARLVDVACVALAYLVAAATLAGELTAVPKPLRAWLAVDIAFALITPPVLFLRRGRPVWVAVILQFAAAVSTTAGAAAAIAAATVTIQRRYQQALAVGGLALAAVSVNLVLRHGDQVYWPIFGVLVLIGALELAIFIRLRLRLTHEAEQRTSRVEADQRARVEQARKSERLRIARDMHDVLAHRISLLSVHAGALAFRPDAPAEQIADAAEVIRAASHDVLTDLQQVIGVLRDETDRAQPDLRPANFAGITALIEEATRAGQVVEADPLPKAPVSAAVGRTAYRVVQEGLTNARKHAPGMAVRIGVEAAEDGMTVAVSNQVGGAPRRRGGSRHSGVPGAGLGLIGLRERVEMLGGRLTYGPVDGSFQLTAWIPSSS